MPKALKSCPKSNKSPNLVTLVRGDAFILMTPMRLGEDRVLRFAIYFELSREVTQKIGKNSSPVLWSLLWNFFWRKSRFPNKLRCWKSLFWTAWPDLCEILPIWQNVKSLWLFLRVYLVFGKILIILGNFLMLLGKFMLL